MCVRDKNLATLPGYEDFRKREDLFSCYVIKMSVITQDWSRTCVYLFQDFHPEKRCVP